MCVSAFVCMGVYKWEPEMEREINYLVESMLIGREAAGFRASGVGVRKPRYIKDMATELAFSALIICSTTTD